MLFVNFKLYQKGTGAEALNLAGILEEISKTSQIKIVPVVQSFDVSRISRVSKFEVWVQHIDAFNYGAHTGFSLAEAAYEAGASGTFLNHSEHKLEDFDQLQMAHSRAQSVGLKTLIFAADLDELEKVGQLKPSYVAYEPPELVGSKTTSVAQAKPDVISKAVEKARELDLPLIVGAGIKSADDIAISMKLGASGVAVASNIVDSEDPKSETLKLIEGF